MGSNAGGKVSSHRICWQKWSELNRQLPQGHSESKGARAALLLPCLCPALQLQSEKDPLCILLRRVLNGQLRGCWAWLSVMAGI